MTKKRRRYGSFRNSRSRRFKTAKRQSRVMVKRAYYAGSWAVGVNATNDFWRYYTFTAANVNNFSEFQNVFDEYKINGIKVTFRPRYDNVDAQSTIAATTAYLPTSHICIDPQSTLIPSGLYNQSNLNAFLEQGNVKQRRCNRPFSVYFKPRVDMGVNGGGTAVKSIKPGYLKTNDTGVVHKGFHIFVQSHSFATATVMPVFDIYYTFYMTFRNLK